MKTIFVSQFEPISVGHGGNHRAYQIVHDLTRIVGQGNVIVVSWPQWLQSHRRKFDKPVLRQALYPRQLTRCILPLRWAVHQFRWLRKRIEHYKRRTTFFFAESPLDLLMNTNSITKQFAHPDFVAYYESVVRQYSPTVCFIEHVGFSNLLPVNQKRDIATIACIQNLEALDTYSLIDQSHGRPPYQMALNLADEIGVLSQCQERLFISQIEMTIANGLGLVSDYYPYLPVGEIRDTLTKIAQLRKQQRQLPGLFLLLGSATHTTTQRSFQWFIKNALEFGLPPGVRIVVAGNKTEALLPPDTSIPGVELRGWTEQAELDSLLTQAQAVLVPQTIGFGALTRLTEMALVGLPVIVSKHPTNAIHPPPNLRIVDNNWNSWYQAMEQLVANNHFTYTGKEYQAWEETQTNTLEIVLGNYIS